VFVRWVFQSRSFMLLRFLAERFPSVRGLWNSGIKPIKFSLRAEIWFKLNNDLVIEAMFEMERKSN
jgi:hypothetical protein